MRKLCILPTTDKYDAIALHHTNGANYGVGTGYIIEWLKKLELKQPFILTCIAHDTLSGRFLTASKYLDNSVQIELYGVSLLVN